MNDLWKKIHDELHQPLKNGISYHIAYTDINRIFNDCHLSSIEQMVSENTVVGFKYRMQALTCSSLDRFC